MNFQAIVISLKEEFYTKADSLIGVYPEVGVLLTIAKQEYRRMHAYIHTHTTVFTDWCWKGNTFEWGHNSFFPLSLSKETASSVKCSPLTFLSTQTPTPTPTSRVHVHNLQTLAFPLEPFHITAVCEFLYFFVLLVYHRIMYSLAQMSSYFLIICVFLC